MIRKVRHPYQIMELSEMTVGELYAFVRNDQNSLSNDIYTMGGVFHDSIGEARMLGHDLNMDPWVDMLFPDAPDDAVVTAHMDGWCGGGTDIDEPTMMYWHDGGIGKPPRLACGFLATCLGSKENFGCHYIVVPNQCWIDDPRLHVTDWSNPDTVIKRATVMDESPAEFDRRMKVKLDAALAKSLGF